MSISVIIPVLNEYEALRQLLPDLIKKSHHDSLEVIVCDGGSSDLTIPFVLDLQHHYPDIVTLVECDLGRANQMNAGAKIARYSLFLFLHADTQLPNNWFELVKNEPWSRFNVKLSGQHFMFRVIETLMNWRSCFTQVATGDQAIAVSKALFNQVDGYPMLPLMEDVALCKRLRQYETINCIKTPLITSSRRWEKHGIIKTIGLMWIFRFLYFMGVSAKRLALVYYPNMKQKRHPFILQIFTKLPIQGYVKTRLIPQVGAPIATAIHEYLLNTTLKVAQESLIPFELWVAREKHHNDNDSNYDQFDQIAQQGNDLGDRMAYAIKQGLLVNQKVVLIGSDCLELSADLLQQSIDLLDDFDVVLTPVADGGFISIACRYFDDRLFSDVAWGTETALEDVVANSKKLSLNYHLLQPVRDVDTYDDVQNYPELMKLIN